MKCDCIKKLKEKLKQMFGEKSNPEIETILSIENGEMDSFIPIRATYHRIKKDGTTAKNKLPISIRGKFCPICGKELFESELK